MDDPILGFTIQEYAGLVRGVIFEIRSSVDPSLRYLQLAQEELEPSHPAFAHLARALRAQQRARDVVEQFDHEFHRRRREAELPKSGEP
jgi:hypothetical protein